MSTHLASVVAIGIIACNPANPQPPSPTVKAPADRAPVYDASTNDWIDVDCSAVLKTEDIAALCSPARELDNLVPDRNEHTIRAAFDLNPSTRLTCARSLKPDGGGVLVHIDVIDYSTPEGLARITDIWQKSYPQGFKDGLYIHEARQGWIRRDVDGGKGRLAVSAFETDQPGHTALCTTEQLVRIVRLMMSRLP